MSAIPCPKCNLILHSVRELEFHAAWHSLNELSANKPADTTQHRTCICSSTPHTEECDLANFRMTPGGGSPSLTMAAVKPSSASNHIGDIPSLRRCAVPDCSWPVEALCPLHKSEKFPSGGTTSPSTTPPPPKTPSEEGGEGVESVLQEAERIIHGDRRKEYGAVEESFKTVATMWSALFGFPVSPTQVALAMTLLKVCREKAGHKRDSIVDACGYLALAQQIEEAKR